MNAIEVRNLTKSFGKQVVLNNLDLDIPTGCIFGLLGPNGAGKTTFIRIVNQIILADRGEVLLNGRPLNRMDISKIGYMPEERGLYTKMKVGELLIYLSKLKGMNSKNSKEQIRGLLHEFEIYNWWNRKIEQLSKGMQQKIQFIVAIMHNPELIILDEPFTGFDPINTDLITQKILDLNNKGVTFMLSTHRMETVEELCTHIALINKANKLLDGKVSDIKNRFKTGLFEISFLHNENELNAMPGIFQITGLKEPDGSGIITATLKLESGKSINDVIKLIIDKIEIRSINEVIPHIHDIFISQVKLMGDE
jgi:ABC-2 type transport system ATP-binding protein